MDFNSEAVEVPDEEAFQLLIEQLREKVVNGDKDFPANLTLRTDDIFLAKFLRTKNYVVAEAYNTMKRYYANVQRNLDFINGIKPADFTEAFLHGPVGIFRHKSKGRRIGVCHVGLWKPKEIPLRDLQLSSVIIAETLINEVDVQIKGAVIIFDMKGLAFEHVRQLTPREIKRILLTGQEGLPLKISEVHIVNPPPLYWTLYQISMRFVKEKIRKRVHIHSNIKSLHKYLDPAICPESLGGTLTEEEAMDGVLKENIVKANIPYEAMWSGKPVAPVQTKRKLSRKRSSNGELIYGIMKL